MDFRELLGLADLASRPIGCHQVDLDARSASPNNSQKSKIRPLRKNVYTSRFSTRNPKNGNTHIYHFHISESLNLAFFQFWGRGGVIN